MRKKSINSKLLLGFSLLILGTIILFGGKTKGSPSASFESEPVEVVELNVLQEVSDNKFPQRVIIPQISVDLPVSRSRIINGYWEVFTNKAGWGEGSGIPGEIGNQVIFAHAKEGLFLPLRSIKVDDRVYVLTNERGFSYKVTQIKEVYPNEVEVIAPDDSEKLTLYTCSGFRDSKRLIVVAERV